MLKQIITDLNLVLKKHDLMIVDYDPLKVVRDLANMDTDNHPDAHPDAGEGGLGEHPKTPHGMLEEGAFQHADRLAAKRARFLKKLQAAD